MSDDIATADRQRLDKLLKYGHDPALTVVEPEALPVDIDAEWSAGFEDSDNQVRITVVFVRDPDRREEAAAALRSLGAPDSDGGVRVSTNGGMLFYGRSSGPEHTRLRQLASRFAGRE
jgi:hypothetical protein